MDLLKRNLGLQKNDIYLTLLYSCLIPAICGIGNLDQMHAAQCLEKFAAIIGIFLFTPICKPEQELEVREMVVGKKVSYTKILILRLITAMIITALILISLCGIMVLLHSDFPFVLYIYGAYATMLALGGVGFVVSSLSRQCILGYMISFGYFLLNWLGIIDAECVLYLFSMMNSSFLQKHWLLLVGVVSCGGAVTFGYFIKK